MDDQQTTQPIHGLGGPASDDSSTAPTMGLGTTTPFGAVPADPAVISDTSVVAPSTVSAEELVDIKKKALDELSPLVHKLDQNPEEKYKTLMMMIQASDNQDLVRAAYEAAQKITDEKVRAEALLNIVNEINYFTQKAS